ncbi:alpha-ribazole phosphatase [Zhouia spongiae]|uniref:Alpha-ribazole phosphatase n=1 Tax=Zhouia spongiae TaxID=2202721 RepID=A0ABY3YJ56_9FLAO|nr:alpha-ribazole phosphatase [Zhouia spongiae]UNY97676.1 alpha-ribazole phosphatase [Zhouia spongiae]
MEIYLIRHTTPKIDKGICYGQADIPLNENFEKELQNIRKQLPENHNTFKVYTSPLKRCALLAKRISPNVIEDEALKELNFGNWELRKWNDIPTKELDPWMRDFVNVKVPYGESYTDLAKRVHNRLTHYIGCATDNLIIVTHAGPIRAFLATLLQVPLEKSFRIKIPYGSVVHINKTEDQIKLVSKIESENLT